MPVEVRSDLCLSLLHGNDFHLILFFDIARDDTILVGEFDLCGSLPSFQRPASISIFPVPDAGGFGVSRKSRMRPVDGDGSGQSVGATQQRNDYSMTDRAVALYGGDAATAVAYCALEAWCEGDRDEYDFWLDIFKRLRN